MLPVEYRCDVGRAAFASASKSPVLDERDESASSAASESDGVYGPRRQQRRRQGRRDSTAVVDRVFVMSGGKRFLQTRRLGANERTKTSAETAGHEQTTDSSEPPNDSAAAAAAPDRPPLAFVEVTDTAVAERLGSPRDLLPPRITPAFDPTDALPFPFRTNLSRQNTMRTYHEQEEYYRRRRAWIQLQEEKAVALSASTCVASLWADDDGATTAATADPVHHEFAEACWRPDARGSSGSGGADDEKTTSCDSDESREGKVECRLSAIGIAATPSIKLSTPKGQRRRRRSVASVVETVAVPGRGATRLRKSVTGKEATTTRATMTTTAAVVAARSLISAYHESGAALVGAEPRLPDMKNAVILVESRLTQSPSPPNSTVDDATLLARFVPRCVGTPRVMRAVVDCVDSHLIERAHLGSVLLVTAGAWAGLLVCMHSLCFRYRTLPSLVASAYPLPEYAGADEIRDHDVRLGNDGGSSSSSGGGGASVGGDARWRTNRALMEHLRRHNAVEAYERESFDPELAELYPHVLSSSCARNHAIRCALTGVCVRCEVVGVVSGTRYYSRPYYAESAHSLAPSSSSSSFTSSSSSSSSVSFTTLQLGAPSASSPSSDAPVPFSVPLPTLVEDACVVVDLQYLSLHLGADIVDHAFSASPSPFSDGYRPRPLPPYLDAYDFSD